MIDPEKQYRTRDGREVRIYAVDGGGLYPVHGAYEFNDRWQASQWSPMGGFHIPSASVDFDLIEVKPRIKREVWVNVYRWGISGCYETKESADNGEAEGARIACVKAVLDFEEGEGL